MLDNNQLVLISGESGTGKSASLINIKNQDKWFYFNCEVNKSLPFKNSFKNISINDPMALFSYLDQLIENPNKFEGIIIDTLTYLMDMFESQYVINSANTMSSWSDYQQYFKKLMQEYCSKIQKPIIILAHTRADYDEVSMAYRTSVPIKGALKSNGIESYFSTVVSTKKVPLSKLEKYHNDLLNITEEDKLVGYKHVFQTRITEDTTGERIRSPMGLFSVKQTFIDNDVSILLDHLKKFYENT